jgi:glycosyltransferase involved in cell wall biosynthesis
MACGLPVVGARSPGIEGILVHKETGYLCGTSAHEIGAALEAVFADTSLRQRMGDAAADYIRQRCSLDVVCESELRVMRAL